MVPIDQIEAARAEYVENGAQVVLMLPDRELPLLETADYLTARVYANQLNLWLQQTMARHIDDIVDGMVRCGEL